MDIDTVLGWRGRTVRDRDGEKLGSLGDIYLDGDSDRPAYAGVRTGLFGRNESIVPLAGVREVDGDLMVPYEKSLVDSAPNLDPDAALTRDEEDAIFSHYGTQKELDRPDPFEEGMTRSEEEVAVRPGEMQPAERVRLRKYLVTEHVETTIPRRKEVVQLETDPAPDGVVERVEDAGPDERPGERRL